MARTYPPAEDGEWIQPRHRDFRLACCDCGLVHRLDFRIVRSPRGRRQVQFRGFRDARRTAAVRKHKKEQSC